MAPLIALALHCGLVFPHADILAAIVRVESAGNPHALAVNGDVELVRQPRDRDDAVAMARWLAAHGYNFDAGLGQVNSANLVRLGLDAATVFEPCANLRAASRVLEECFERALRRSADEERAMTAALSCYNTGHFTRGMRNGYVGAVRASAATLAALRALATTEGAESSADRGLAAPLASSGHPGAIGRWQRIGDAQRRREAFAMALSDVFDASPGEERAR